MRNGLAALVFILTAFWSTLLNASIISGYHEIRGTAVDFPVKNFDGDVDFSLVMQAATSEELVNFELSRVVSPSNDEIHVLSYTFGVPSNLVLPAQQESYFFTIDLDKPTFRTYLPNDGTYNLYSIRGVIPLKKMINAYQNNESIFNMLNYATFGGGGDKTIKVKGPTSGVTISVKDWN